MDSDHDDDDLLSKPIEKIQHKGCWKFFKQKYLNNCYNKFCSIYLRFFANYLPFACLQCLFFIQVFLNFVLIFRDNIEKHIKEEAALSN